MRSENKYNGNVVIDCTLDLIARGVVSLDVRGVE